MGKILKNKEVSISKQYMVKCARAMVNKTTTNAKIFEVVRSLFGEALDKHTNLTNIGQLYWFLIDTRDKEKAA